MFLGQLFLAFRNWPDLTYPISGLSRYFTIYLIHIPLSHSAVTFRCHRSCSIAVPVLQLQGYGCPYSVYTSLSLVPHYVWGQYKLPWHSNLLPNVSEYSIYIWLTHQSLRSRDFPSPGANSEPAGSRQIPPSSVGMYALTAATLEKLWRRVIVHQNEGWHIAAVCTSF
jgi:hypothetical protein